MTEMPAPLAAAVLFTMLLTAIVGEDLEI